MKLCIDGEILLSGHDMPQKSPGRIYLENSNVRPCNNKDCRMGLVLGVCGSGSGL